MGLDSEQPRRKLLAALFCKQRSELFKKALWFAIKNERRRNPCAALQNDTPG